MLDVFKGKAVAIVGGGPSLTGVNMRQFNGHTVVALTKSFQFLPDAAMLWWSGSDFWRGFKEGILAHRAPIKATGDADYLPEELPPAITQFHFTGERGFDPDEHNLRTGNCSAFAAMHLLAHAMPSKIVLFGIDMQHGPNGEKNYHGGYGIYQSPDIFEQMMLPHFRDLVEPLAERKIEVVNASPQSALTLWPRVSVDEGLAALGAAQSIPRGNPPVIDDVPLSDIQHDAVSHAEE